MHAQLLSDVRGINVACVFIFIPTHVEGIDVRGVRVLPRPAKFSLNPIEHTLSTFWMSKVAGCAIDPA